MKLSLLTLAALVAIAAADNSIYRKQADSAFLDKQRKVLKLYVGLGADTKTSLDYEHVPFPYNKPDLYKKEGVVESFVKIYERGLLDRRGVFTLFCEKNRKDTFKIFNLFYFAKDFDTFFNVVSWARDEFNPVQWGYAFTMAVFHREDTRGIYIPPLYEIMPQYFVQSEVMHQAISAKQQGENYGKFEVNNTGWEWSWHSSMLTGPHKASSKWVGDDVEIRLSYFREDVGLSNFFTYFNLRFASWLSTEEFPDIHFNRRGELFYSVFKWIKNRYNLERMSNGLAPVVPFQTYDHVPGYNPHIQDIFGRSFLVRGDNMVPQDANPDGSWELGETLTRVNDLVDSTVFWDPTTGKTKKLIVSGEERKALDEFSKIIYSIHDGRNTKFYKFPYYDHLAAADDMVHAPNDRDYTTTALGMSMTRTRDPAFYMILANIDFWFERFFATLPPYTEKELNFPGVSIEKIEHDKLETYFERYDWELTNGINFAQRSDRVSKKFEASQFRLNHKPFSFKLAVKSDKEADAFVRLFLGPKTDADGRAYSLDQQRRAMIIIDGFRTKVKSGDNVLERNSHQFTYFEDYQHFRSFYEKVNKSIDTKEPFYYNEMWQCGAPHNLVLPRGWKSGKEFALFAIVTPYEYTSPTEGYYPCHQNVANDQFTATFPFDRPIHFNEFLTPNMKFTTAKIYHEGDVVSHEEHSH